VDLVGADHHDRQTGVEEGVDDLSVAAFDRDLADASAAQSAHELAHAGAGGVDVLPLWMQTEQRGVSLSRVAGYRAWQAMGRQVVKRAR
jgi:hypothetical protein